MFSYLAAYMLGLVCHIGDSGVSNQSWHLDKKPLCDKLSFNELAFSLCLSVARIDTPPLRPAALAFVLGLY